SSCFALVLVCLCCLSLAPGCFAVVLGCLSWVILFEMGVFCGFGSGLFAVFCCGFAMLLGVCFDSKFYGFAVDMVCYWGVLLSLIGSWLLYVHAVRREISIGLCAGWIWPLAPAVLCVVVVFTVLSL
ncbi:hypothetical protein U1Q18_037460, partial [Sarracenia purpurea var. burkii]